MIGRIFGQRYRAVRLLGAGGMGHVYEAEDLTGGPKVALKVISSAELAGKEGLVKRFWREAHAAHRLETDHVARVLDIGTDLGSGMPYMAMELLRGEDLHQLVRRVGPLGSRVALRIAAQACEGLVRAHEAGIVHRDIKPANLFLHRESNRVVVKVLDFGIAKSLLDRTVGLDTRGLTGTGALLGSPLYMSPEQARGAKSIDYRTDLWSLGAVLHFGLSGRAPHQHIDSLGELIFAICSGPPPLVQDVAPWVTPDVAAVVARCLRLSPDERFQSAPHIRDAVLALLPGGSHALDETMLAGVSLEESSSIAPKLAVPDPLRALRSVAAPPLGLAPTAPPLAPAAALAAAADPGVRPLAASAPVHEISGAVATSYGGTNAGVSSSLRARDGRRSVPWLAMGLAALALAGGAVGMAVLGGSSRPNATTASVIPAAASASAAAEVIDAATAAAVSASAGPPAPSGSAEAAEAAPPGPRPSDPIRPPNATATSRPGTTARRPGSSADPAPKPSKLDPNGFGDDRK